VDKSASIIGNAPPRRSTESLDASMSDLHRTAAKQITESGLSGTARIILGFFSGLFGAVMFLTAPSTDLCLRRPLSQYMSCMCDFWEGASILRKRHWRGALSYFSLVHLHAIAFRPHPAAGTWRSFALEFHALPCRIWDPWNWLRDKGSIRLFQRRSPTIGLSDREPLFSRRRAKYWNLRE